MKYRTTEIMAASDLGPAGTHIMDLNVVDPISRIVVGHEPVGGNAVPIEHPTANIVRLELLDGSDVLYGLTGKVGQALNIFEAKGNYAQAIQYLTGGTPHIAVNMDFGRYLWDEELAFDPKKFSNPQVRLTWDEDAFDGACTAHRFTMYAHCFDEKAINPVGFLMSKELKAYPPAIGGFEYTDLPTDYPIRKLIVQAYRLAAGPRGLVDLYRLSEDNQKRMIFDGDLNELRHYVELGVGVCREDIRTLTLTTGTNVFCTPTWLQNVGFYNATAANPVAIAVAGNRITATVGTANAVVHYFVMGDDPHGCICFPFGKQDDLGDWYDTPSKGSVVLRLRGGPAAAATDTVRIATQQLRHY